MNTRNVIFSLCFLFISGLPIVAEEARANPKENSNKNDQDDKWDVNNPPGPSKEIPISVNEGTWMSVDVHPSGKEIVFDLLGDIYLLPLAGGDAKALTKGRAWDMQPRFSPNGKWIAFTSDRNGGDNIWVMDRDGSNPREITKETFRLLNSPTWSADSEYIAARKHFTSRRSLGAGEIWMYHRSGGSGVQVTKKSNDQKDLGEPAFSSDGRYLYFSKDSTPGKTFEYNKDSNKGIYTIQRLSLDDGRIEEWVGGPGGAIRPTPSPDGKHMGFIRRIRGKSILMVQDQISGEEWSVYGDMDRDLQETWAIHGVYPGISWTPSGKELVFWAGGKLWRSTVQSRQTLPIPFKITGKRTVSTPLRYEVDVHPAQSPIHMARWFSISPDGKKVVFQALGMLYIQNTNGSKAKRLTRNKEMFEFYPSWSRDSKRIVYTTWNDKKLGSVRVQTVGGGESKVLTRNPGHYVEPVFSPNGRSVLYRKAKGGHLVSPAWSRQSGVYQVSSNGGKSEWVSEDGLRPHFGASNGHFFRTTQGKDGPQLVKKEFKSREEVTLFRSKYSTRITVSPNEKWVAFAENYQAYVFPMIHMGKPIMIGPKMKQLPMKKASINSASHLHWSGDSASVHWSEGPHLMGKNISSLFPNEGVKKAAWEPIRANLKVNSDVPTGKIALLGGRVITMDGNEVIENGIVIIEDNRIVHVGNMKDSNTKVPEGSWTLDCTGKTIVPGLVDVHAHASQSWNGMTPQQNWENLATLAFGVTTTHDPSNNTESVFAAAEMARSGRILAPRIFSTGTILYGATASITAKIDSLDDALAHVKRLRSVGAISVKSYNQPRRDQRQQVIEAARQTRMMVVPEGGALFHHNMTQVVDGHTGIEHALPIGAIYDDVIQLWSQTPVGYTPTLGVAYGGLSGKLFWFHESDVWNHPLLSLYVPWKVLDPETRRAQKAPLNEWNHIQAAQGATDLVRAGGKVQIGAHGEREGLASHWEMWMLAQGGMTPHEALRAATIDGAFYLGLHKDIGSIEKGKLADLMIIEGNPLEDIRQSEKVTHTILNGRVYETNTLNEVGNHPHQRAPLFFKNER